MVFQSGQWMMEMMMARVCPSLFEGRSWRELDVRNGDARLAR